MAKSWLLVIVQFSAIAYYLITGSLIVDHLGLLILEVVGLFLGLWAIKTMRPLNVSVFPEPKDDADLISEGPYAWIRHPMYTAVLLVCLAMTLDRQAPLDWGVFGVLALNQWIKLHHEERLLEKKFEGYKAYKAKTKALIPFLL